MEYTSRRGVIPSLCFDRRLPEEAHVVIPAVDR
jgi:hypothetical protein